MPAKATRTRSTTVQIGNEDASAPINGHSASIPPDSHTAALEKQVAKLQKQCEELSQEVKFLSSETSSSIFDSSMVLSERVFSAEEGLRRATAELKVVRAERDNLREDLKGHKDSKRLVDNSWREERKRAERLEKELQFYQGQSARAMKDRDQMGWEAEELRKRNLDLDSRATEAESRAENAETEQAETRQQLDEAEERIRGLEVKARECESIPSLWKHIEESSKQIDQLKAAQDGLQRSLSIAKHDYQEAKDQCSAAQHQKVGAERDLEDVRSKIRAEGRQTATKIRTLEARVEEVEGQNASLEVRAEEAEGNLAAAQAEAERASTELDKGMKHLSAKHSEKIAVLEASLRSEIESLQKELQETKADLKRVTAEFEQASGEKVQALLRVSQAEQTAEQAFEETGNLLDQLADLKENVQKATQEKVAAVLQVANLKEQLRALGEKPASSPTVPPAQQKGYSWRIWGQASEAAPDAPSKEAEDQKPPSGPG